MEKMLIEAGEEDFETRQANTAEQEEKTALKDQDKAYKEENHNCDVPQRYPTDPPFGKWVHNQRHGFGV